MSETLWEQPPAPSPDYWGQHPLLWTQEQRREHAEGIHRDYGTPHEFRNSCRLCTDQIDDEYYRARAKDLVQAARANSPSLRRQDRKATRRALRQHFWHSEGWLLTRQLAVIIMILVLFVVLPVLSYLFPHR